MKCGACGRLGTDLDHRAGPPPDVDVPHGRTALLLGLLIAGLGVAALFGLVPSLDLSVKLAGIALAVTGYLTCVVIPQLNRRIHNLEQGLSIRINIYERRLSAIEEQQERQGGEGRTIKSPAG
jgi:hypothetical protein